MTEGDIGGAVEAGLESRETVAALIGWMATVVAVLMWSSLLDQIRLNLSGQKGSVIFAVAVVVNCCLWCAYSLLKKPRLWPVFVSNAPGVLLGALALVTAL